MDFICTLGWMIVSTGSMLSRHPEFWSSLSDFSMLKSTSTLIPLNLTGVTSNQLLDTTMLCSTCISGGLLTSVYNRGREERLHGPLGIITFITTFAIYITTRVPLDILREADIILHGATDADGRGPEDIASSGSSG
ncbi:hypothetical protein DH86_00004315 [Scytalidium sp. 3C]|nr:hypothetical protein DH86_00004315 [Scytalidium sp. 3C]